MQTLNDKEPSGTPKQIATDPTTGCACTGGAIAGAAAAMGAPAIPSAHAAAAVAAPTVRRRVILDMFMMSPLEHIPPHRDLLT